jgi:DNA-binding IscR family transcriptional regulator
MEMFQQIRLVLPLADDETFVLARDPETISIKEILDCVKNAGKKMRAQIRRTEEESEIDEMLLGVDRSAAEALAGKTLQRFILKLSPPQSRGNS